MQHMEHGRPLCSAENNTCTNLAGKKDVRNGKQRYHNKCDKHRRFHHAPAKFRNPNSIRYIPLNKCVMCNEAAAERHRIIPGSEYTASNVLALCRPCHVKIHLMMKELRAKGYAIGTV